MPRKGGESMPDEKQVWLGKELERLAMQPDTIVNVTPEGGDGEGQEPAR